MSCFALLACTTTKRFVWLWFLLSLLFLVAIVFVSIPWFLLSSASLVAYLIHDPVLSSNSPAHNFLSFLHLLNTIYFSDLLL